MVLLFRKYASISGDAFNFLKEIVYFHNMIKIDPVKIKLLLERGVHEIHPNRESLEKKLLSGRQLRIKFGIDPTAPDLHLGHSVVLRKLKQFQNLGHKVILLIGDFTATIGDPSGKSSTRSVLTEKQVRKNMKDYLKQAGKILAIKKTEIRYNTEWFGKMKMKNFYSLAKIESVSDLKIRSMFREREEKKELLTLSEFTYPLLQGYDSVELKCDVELGGEDQIFNMLHGRKVQKRYNMPEQDVITVPLLEGTDGVKKMSKSTGNYIGLSQLPHDMYGKIMRIPDSLILKYVELLTDMNLQEIKKIQNPRDQKAVLAKEIVKMYHNEKEAQKAEDEFNKNFRDKNPTFIEMTVDEAQIFYPELLSRFGMANSTSEAKRLITAGAVDINGVVDKEWKKMIDIDEKGVKIKVGKRNFIRVKLR